MSEKLEELIQLLDDESLFHVRGDEAEAWDEIRRLARLGASIEDMPTGTKLHRSGDVDTKFWFYWDAEGIDYGAPTPQEALDKGK